MAPSKNIMQLEQAKFEESTNAGDSTVRVSSYSNGHICNENSSSAALGSNATFTGVWQDTLNYNVLIVGIKADQNSATDGLVVQWSSDTVAVEDTDVFTITANSGKVFTFSPARRYVRLIYTNGASAQSSFSLQTVFKKGGFKGSSHRIQDSIVAEDDAELVKAVITGKNPAGTFVNFQSTTAGNFKTSLEELESGVSLDSNSTLRVAPMINDEYGNITRQLGDNIFKGAVLTIPVEHHEIHCGDSYSVSYALDLTNGQELNILVVVPNEGLTETQPGEQQGTKQYHFTGAVNTEGEAEICFYEAAVASDAGTALTVFNRNRNSTNDDFLAISYGATMTDDGTMLEIIHRGSGRSVGGTVDRSNEWILKDNTTYLLRITNSTANNNYISFELNYYVHPGI